MKLMYLFASLLDVMVLKQATEKIFKAMSQRDRMIEQIYDFIHGSESDEMYCVMVELVNRLDDNIDAEERSEDETWFAGLRQSFNNKEDAMRDAAKSRIRKYFSNAKESFEKVFCATVCLAFMRIQLCEFTLNARLSAHDVYLIFLI